MYYARLLRVNSLFALLRVEGGIRMGHCIEGVPPISPQSPKIRVVDLVYLSVVQSFGL